MIRTVGAFVCQKRFTFGTRCHGNIAVDRAELKTNTQEAEAIRKPIKEATGQLKSKPSERYLKFKEKLRSNAPLACIPKGVPHPAHEKEPLKPWPNNTNPHTGEIGGPRGPEPTRYGDWESKGRVTDF